MDHHAIAVALRRLADQAIRDGTWRIGARVGADPEEGVDYLIEVAESYLNQLPAGLNPRDAARWLWYRAAAELFGADREFAEIEAELGLR